jgi:hypothetical protein
MATIPEATRNSEGRQYFKQTNGFIMASMVKDASPGSFRLPNRTVEDAKSLKLDLRSASAVFP